MEPILRYLGGLLPVTNGACSRPHGACWEGLMDPFPRDTYCRPFHRTRGACFRKKWSLFPDKDEACSQEHMEPVPGRYGHVPGNMEPVAGRYGPVPENMEPVSRDTCGMFQGTHAACFKGHMQHVSRSSLSLSPGHKELVAIDTWSPFPGAP